MYADVIVDISHESLDRVFLYRIPDEILPDVAIGSPVKFPFGKGNRITEGYVIDILSTSDYPEDKIKSLIGLRDGAVSIESQLINLAAWMKNTYGSTMIQALKTVIPIKNEVRHKENKTITLNCDTEKAEEFLKLCVTKKYKAKERLLAELIKEKSLPYELVTQKLNISQSTLKSLEADNFIAVRADIKYRNPADEKAVADTGFGRSYDIKRLTGLQQAVADSIMDNYNCGDRKPSLIHGVTGSGKTEVYMELVSKMQKLGKQSIVLIPEIALTYQTIIRFYKRFGNRVSIIHSRMSQGEKYDQFERAKKGEIDIMIGPRSALFTPFPNIGLIIIDEEHEATYKSETTPKYHAREVALERARVSDGIVVLGSATPSMESYYNASCGNYNLYSLTERIGTSTLPEVSVVDLREELKAGNRSMFSTKLREAIQERLDRKEQVMLFINRRGYAGFVSCRSCGEAIKCPHCDVSLTYHNNKRLICHYCNYNIPMPDKCPKCSSKFIGTFGTGTQKLEEATNASFPGAKVLRMDMDTTAGKDGHEKILSAFANQEADILIGTQMIVKGHDFPNVTLVGIIAADMSLFENDYRSAERTFQLLTQAAGRAGRGDKPGQVIIQTYNPEHYAIQTASAQDYGEFYETELSYRRLVNYPPFLHMLVIFISSPSIAECGTMAEILVNVVQDYGNYTVIGPADATIAKKQDRYRKVIWCKHTDVNALKELMNALEAVIKTNTELKNCSVQFDLDPMSMY